MNSVSRLMRVFAPDHYDLSLSIEREARVFSGIVTISGAIASAANDIRLHSKDLTITSLTLDGIATPFHSDDHDELVITPETVTLGAHVLRIEFNGTITNSMQGIYPCYYQHDGEKKELIATQFESHYARGVFPCIDEPEAKATYSLTLETESGITVLGNMPVISQQEKGTRLVTIFDTTPKMSSYLLAWVAGELHKKTAYSASGVEVNIWATPAQPHNSLDFALDIATRSIDFFNDYFQVPYPLPKSDHVALPDFSSGAMENWGLITYRESALLVEPGITSLDDAHYIATVIAHELSHQWFGNLVTMKWWNDLWLNESFANMMEYVAIDALEPSWNIWLDSATSGVVSALRRDSLDGIQTIQCDVNHPDEINTLFDPSIVYAKGGRLLGMLRHYLGESDFRDGLRLYFKLFAYQNTEADDLWGCFAEVSGKDVKNFMHAWITQPGYPVVRVEQNGTDLTISQKRFFIGPHQESSLLWPIPLNSSIDGMPDMLREESLTIQLPITMTPIQLNMGSTSHFITQYDSSLMAPLLASVPTLPIIDRLALLHEQTLLAKAGSISSAELIPLLDSYRTESHEAVWSIISLAIGELKSFVEPESAAELSLKTLVGTLAAAQYERLGWDALEGEPLSDTQLRSTIISSMLYSGDPAASDEAVRRYRATNLENLDPELRSVILSHVVRLDIDGVVETLIAAYASSSNSNVKDDITAGLTSTKDQLLTEKLLKYMQDTSFIRPQDFIHWFVWLLQNRYSKEQVWNWVQDNWEWVEKTFKSDSHYDMFPRYIAGGLRTRQHLSEYQTFFESRKDDVTLRRNIELGVQDLSGRVELLERDSQAVQAALVDLKPR